VATSKLYARLFHAFLVTFFHEMKGICVNFTIPDLFSDYSRDVAMATVLEQN